MRLVRVKRVGALVLLMGTGPKSCVAGVRIRPVRGRPVPVRVKGAGGPEGGGEGEGGGLGAGSGGGELDSEPAVGAGASEAAGESGGGWVAVAVADVFDEDGCEVGGAAGGGEVGKGEVIFCQRTLVGREGHCRSARVPLGVVMMAVPVPVSET